LFEAWAQAGVPAGIDYPKTQSDAVGWKCERFGIKGVGSRREFRATNPEYGAIVKEIKALIAKLRPEGDTATQPNDGGRSGTAIGGRKRIYRTQKARRIAAEDSSARYKAMLENTLTQLHETRQALASLERDLKVERQLVVDLKRENAKLQDDSAQLKRQMAMRSGVLHALD
jgi:chromosome segregation ATPase